MLTGSLVTDGFNRSTVVAVQGAIGVLPKGTFLPYYNTTDKGRPCVVKGLGLTQTLIREITEFWNLNLLRLR